MALTNPGPVEFDGIIQQDEGTGSAGYVDFPFDLEQTFGKDNLVPVRVLFDESESYRGSLANIGREYAMVLIRKDILERLGKTSGDTVHVRVELDEDPRAVELADDAQDALGRDSRALEQWSTLTYSHQREFDEWIESAKQAETRQRRIRRMVNMVANGERLK